MLVFNTARPSRGEPTTPQATLRLADFVRIRDSYKSSITVPFLAPSTGADPARATAHTAPASLKARIANARRRHAASACLSSRLQADLAGGEEAGSPHLCS